MNNKILYGLIGIAFVGGLFSAVYAGPMMPKITLDGDVDVTNDLDVGGTLTGVETLEGLTCIIGKIPRWNGIQWECSGPSSLTIPQMKHVILNDEGLGNLAGWNPDGVVTSYTIADNHVSRDSLIVASTQRSGSTAPTMMPSSFACTNLLVSNGFFSLSGCSTFFVPDGATLRYTVINPYP